MLYATVRQRKIYVKKPTTVIQNGVGVDELTLDMDAEWGSMDSIICVFTLKYTESTSTTETDSDGNSTTKITTETKEITKQMLHTYGTTLLVPWECLVKTGLLSVSCTGYVGSTKIMTTMLPDSFWNVVQNGAITGDETIDPTPTLYQQIVAAAGAATTAAAAANDAAAAANDAATTAKSAAEKIKDASGADGVTPSLSIGTVETLAAGSGATASITGTDEKPVLNLGIPKGADGSGGGGGETWELLASQTLTEAVKAISLNLSSPTKHFIVQAYMPKSSGTNNYISFGINGSYNNIWYYALLNIPTNSDKSQCTVEACALTAGMWKTSLFANMGAAYDSVTTYNVKSTVAVGLKNNAETVANSVLLRAETSDESQYFPAESVFRVWGVKEN